MELEDDEEEEAALAEEADKLSDDEDEDDEKKEETKKEEETDKHEDTPQAKAPGTLRLPQQKGLNNFIGYLVDDEEEDDEGGDSVNRVKCRRENDRTGATDQNGEPSDVAKPHKYIRWDSEGITKQRKAAMKAPGLQHGDEVTAKGEFLPTWLGKVAGEAPGERFSARLAIALEKLLKLSIKHKVKHINAVEFGASELPRVAYSFKIVESATTTLEEDIDKRESTGGWLLTDILAARSDDRERRKANAKMDYIDVRYLDDSARDWWRRAVAAALNRTEKARTWKRMFQDAPIKDQKK
eukprot:GHVN01089226.1.p1 GENE.GHVN01089226.1~~GHVN01089226.1.p1  ORF type:complete len:297 (-),score=93.90 GHVN01089226.1:104-994(-)